MVNPQVSEVVSGRIHIDRKERCMVLSSSVSGNTTLPEVDLLHNLQKDPAGQFIGAYSKVLKKELL